MLTLPTLLRRCLRCALLAAAALIVLGVLAAPAAAATAPTAAAVAATPAATAPVAAPGPSVPAATAPFDDPAAVAERYLQARAAASTAPDPAAALALWFCPGSPLAAREALLARGVAERRRALGHFVDDMRCDVTIVSVELDPAGETATVTARAVVTTDWHARGGDSVEASAVDHRVQLRREGDRWLVTADRYLDTLSPALLEAAGADAAQVARAAAALELHGDALLPQPLEGDRLDQPDSGAALLPALRAIYPEVIYYDRSAAAAYADRYALNYNSTYIRFSADCCNFASQCARAGKMPQIFLNTVTWWYDKNGTSSPVDDKWSTSWPWVPLQMSSWAGRRISWVTSITSVTKGDFVYYDWTGDGTWDHVAVLVGTNSLGQKVVDAHTTDHYRVYWKLGTASTKYKFARVYTRW
jgi:hypothetical protein